MAKATRYGQFCPIAKAAEILATLWTFLILREPVCGSTRFNDIHRGMPLMSRSLLSQRLKELEKAPVIERIEDTHARGVEYRLTTRGEDLRPIVLTLGVWRLRWAEIAIDSDEWDAGVLMWDMRRRIDHAALPRGKCVIYFKYPDAPAELRQRRLVLDSGA